jgi:hypothetical protein
LRASNPLYIRKPRRKVERKRKWTKLFSGSPGTKAESLQKAIDAKTDLETFFAKAPRFQPNASLIKGVVCGVRVEEVEDETMRKIRYLGKLSTNSLKVRPWKKILRK